MVEEVTIADHTFSEFYASNYVQNYLCVFEVPVITRSAGGGSLPESANGSQIDRRVLYRLLIISC